MNDPKKDISKLQDEMDKAREDAAKFQRSEALNPGLYQPRARGDATPGEAASRGWIWRCGVGRLNWVALIQRGVTVITTESSQETFARFPEFSELS